MGTVNTLEYVTTATTGNTTDFGDLTVAKQQVAGTSDGTRAVFGGGASGGYSNVIGYITIGTTGNASDFGDLTVAKRTTATSSGHGGIA
jgi:hypothetical protein|tara:strand:+ start:907 stop:1173 length:267 start_codon:yes stop_codon:yes gene_type:complete